MLKRAGRIHPPITPMTEKDTLRRRAEAQLGTLPEKPERLEPEDFQRTLHELQVHQIELEMQNEEPVSYTHLTLPTKRIV